MILSLSGEVGYNRTMEISLEIIVGELLRQQAFTLAVAESCTGGLLSHRLTNVPGSSTYFMGGIVSYSNEAKVSLLNVKKETLEKYGAVSRETAIEMARGIRFILGAEVGVALTGIAGPGGGSPDKPVGLTWIGLSMPRRDDAWRFVWPGNRLENKESSVDQALKILVKALSEDDSHTTNNK
jgi:PncC family amidohydrolase